MEHVEDFLGAVELTARYVNRSAVKSLINELTTVRQRQGRVFVLGVGGSAANASHFVNDLRKLCGIECYAPTDNVAEVTARTNDEGWSDVFTPWLETSRLSNYDAIFVLSVGGGSVEKNVSVGIIRAINHALKVGARVLGIVGRSDGWAALNGHVVVVVPDYSDHYCWLTPLSESFQSVIMHCLVSHPQLQRKETKW